MITLCRAIASAFLSEREARQALEQRLLPILSYPLHELHHAALSMPYLVIAKNISWSDAPELTHANSSHIYAPLKYRGMMLPEFYA